MPEAAPPDLYGIVNCDQVKKARHWLDQARIAYRFHDFKKEPPSAALVTQWLSQMPWEQLVNQRGTTWRALAPKLRPSDATSALAAILSNPSLVKRPVLVAGQSLMVGFDAERYQQMIDSLRV